MAIVLVIGVVIAALPSLMDFVRRADVSPQGKGALVEGRPEGTGATSSALKLHVRVSPSQTKVVSFDRRDWYVAGLEQRLADADLAFVRASGVVTVALEVDAEDVLVPEELGAYRWDRMPEASHAKRSELDREWDVIVDAYEAGAAPTKDAPLKLIS